MSRKNIRLLDGIPLIAHTIKAAQQSRMLDAVVVSTEDEEIARIAAEYDTQVIRRPMSLAEDWVQNTDVVRHALEVLGDGYGYVVLLQPTSPLRTSSDIDACLSPLINGEARSVITVTQIEHHPGKALLLDHKWEVQPFTTVADMEARRQDLPMVYRQNGAVYGLGREEFLLENRFILFPCRAHIMSQENSIDIDNEFDFFIAERILESRKSGSSGYSTAGTANV